MNIPWDASQRAFADAAAWFADTAGRIGDRWDLSGLGEWTVRDLVGHTSRALLTVESYLAKPAHAADVDSAASYYLATREIAAGPGVAARGREAGAALGSDPAGEIGRIAARVVPIVGEKTGAELLTTIAGGMRLADYLPTRTFELAVHTADLAVALELPPDVPASAAGQALLLVADLAVTDLLAGPLLLAVTGRGELPSGFSVM